MAGLAERYMPRRVADSVPFFLGLGLLDAWSQIVSSEPFFNALTPGYMVLKDAVPIAAALVLMIVCARFSPLVRRRYREGMYLLAGASALGSCVLALAIGGGQLADWIALAIGLAYDGDFGPNEVLREDERVKGAALLTRRCPIGAGRPPLSECKNRRPKADMLSWQALA